MRTLISLCLILAGVPAWAQTGTPAGHETEQLQVNPNTGETPEQFAARTQWWRDGKFGMFIHWGIYSVPADSTDLHGSRVAGEWYFSNKQAQVKDYEKFASQFDPVRFDAHKWVQIAKDAGMKYIVITTKHHDGFCMFGTKLDPYNIVDATPFHRDPMKELAAECKRQGITLCFYHSIMDWHEPDYLPRRPWEGANRLADGASLDRYIQHMEGQLRELLTNYGRIGIIWFDGGWEHNGDELHSEEVNRLIRSLQPGIMINDRNHEPQDYSTPEQTIPAGALPNGRLWETCMTMNGTWGYAKNDTDWKSADDLIHKLCDIASKGGNFLLNVGPTDLGEIPSASVERLARIGQWMRVNGASIYGTTKSPWRRLTFDGRCTRKGDTLYLQVFHWPEGGVKLYGLKTKVQTVTALDGRKRLDFGTDGTTITIPEPKRLDPDATVVELKLAGAPVVDATAPAAHAGADGRIVLRATDADISGKQAQIETKDGIDNVGFWFDAGDTVAWRLVPPKEANYTVQVELAAPQDSAGGQYRIELSQPGAGGALSTVVGVVPNTGAWDSFQTVTLMGAVQLEPGVWTLRVVPTSIKPGGALMNLRSISLTPAP